MNLAQKTALNIPFIHVYPGASRVCLALRNCHGFPLCRFWRSVAWNGLPSPPCLRPWANIQVKQWQTLSSPWWVHGYCGVGECPAILRGDRERKRERKKKKLVCQPKWETKGVQDFVLAHVPKPSFGVLIYCGMLAFSTEVRERIVWPPNNLKKSAAHGCVNAGDSH